MQAPRRFACRTGGSLRHRLALLVLLSLGLMPWAPAASQAAESNKLLDANTLGVTGLHFNSAKGDYIGQGIVKTWTLADGKFTARKNFDNGVQISFDGGSSANWTLNFAAPQDAPLAVGEYTDATRYPFQSPTKPGLDVSGSGRGCNASFGKFTVLEITYGTGDEILVFAADFEQHCEQLTAPALLGRVLFNAKSTTLTTTGPQTPSDTQAPTVPGGLTATAASSSQIDLAWTASTDNVGVSTYSVRRGGVTIATLAGSVTRYSNTGLAPSTTYSYTVSACDTARNCSTQSAAASATTLASTASLPLGAPSGLVATAVGGSQVNLTWTAAPGNVATYRLYRDGTLIATIPPVTRYSDYGLTRTTHSYTVAACDAAGRCSEQSPAATAGVPTSPPTCTLSAAPAAVAPGATSTLTANCSPAATSYVWSANTGFGSTVAIGTVSPAATTAYTVAGVNAGGTGNTASVTVTVTTSTAVLTVVHGGSGYGSVASTPAGIACYKPVPGTAYLVAPDCTETYASGASVTLAATAVAGSAFGGWSGACTGTGGCTVTLDAAKSVTATFNQARFVKGDLSGDGRSDLVWHNARTGATSVWLMDGTSMASSSDLLTNPDWKVVASRDFNGDGKADLVWHNARTGSTSIWLMNGTAMVSFADLLTNPDWRVIAAGDLDGDGKADLIWHNAATGATSAWLMDGATMRSFADLLVDRNWKVVATGDLDGDGKADLIWHNAATGATSAWRMNGTTMLSFADLLTNQDWRVVATGDLDGDGKSDLVWHNARTGSTSAWLMNGTAMVSFSDLLTNPDWMVVTTGDFNGDGKADLVWYNARTGSTSVWRMDGASMSSFGDLLTDPDWKVIGY